MPLIHFLVLLSTASAAPTASATTPTSLFESVLCARYLDNQEQAGERVVPAIARDYLNDVLGKLTAGIETSRLALPEATRGQRWAERLADFKTMGRRFVTPDAGAAADSRIALYRRQRVSKGMRELRDLIAVSADTETPMRRLLEGRAAVERFLADLQTQALADQALLDEGHEAELAVLRQERARILAERKATFKTVFEKVRREGADDWRKRVFGPDSNLKPGWRLALMAGYFKNVVGFSLLSAVVSRRLIPVTAVTLGAGWWGVRQWIYLGAEHAGIFVSGYKREWQVNRAISDIERFRRDSARADMHLADLAVLSELARRNDQPNAVAAFTYDVALPMDRREPVFNEVLNGHIVRRALERATSKSEGVRWARLHHVLSFDANGEPRLATNVIDRSKLPSRARAWASTLIVQVFGPRGKAAPVTPGAESLNSL